MRLPLPMLLLAFLAACGDSAAVPAGDTPSNSPPPPINDSDDGVFTQPGSTDPSGGGDTGPGGGAPGGGPGGGPNGPGGGGGGGNPPGAPVPEPGTMLLVGSGLAGAAYARRRRRKDPEADAASQDAS